MPTIKPRVQVTLEPETHAVIERFAELQGRTRGSVIAELLDAITPSLARTVALLEAAIAAPESVKGGLRGVVEGIHDELVSVSGDASRQFDILLDQLDKQAAAEGEQGHPAPQNSPPNPHVVTRGSGHPTPTHGKQSKKPINPSKSGHTAHPTDDEYKAAIKAAVASKKRG